MWPQACRACARSFQCTVAEHERSEKEFSVALRCVCGDPFFPERKKAVAETSLGMTHQRMRTLFFPVALFGRCVEDSLC